jgi:hypothetical protein
LPDLIVEWTDSYSHGSHGVGSRYGEVRWSPTDPLPSGRSGNHTPFGWFVVAGPGITVGPAQDPIDSTRIAATIFSWMGGPVPERFRGRGIERLAVQEPTR